MATLAPQSPQYTHWSQPQPKGALDHIPGEDGWPVLGSTLTLLADPIGFGDRMRAKYGDVFRNHAFGRRSVMLFGADANELVLFDRDKNFSSAQGWGSVLDLLFPRGLMLLDFDHHRADRRALVGGGAAGAHRARHGRARPASRRRRQLADRGPGAGRRRALGRGGGVDGRAGLRLPGGRVR